MLLALIDTNRRCLGLLQLAFHQLLWVARHTRLLGFADPVLERDLVEASFAAKASAVNLQIIVVNEHFSFLIVTELACAAHLEASCGATTRPNNVRSALVEYSSDFGQRDTMMVLYD